MSASQGGTVLLTTEHLSKHFGGVNALQDLSLELREGEILGVIGPNGAGKSTLINLLTGVYPSSGGRVFFRHRLLNDLPTYRRSRLGIARTFQTPQVFGELTVLENVKVGIYGPHPWRGRIPALEERCLALLEGMGLSSASGRKARELAYGPRRILEIARALATNPSVLLLDEPGAGMGPGELDDLAERLSAVRERGVGVMMVEHNMRLVLRLSDRLLVLVSGREAFAGSPEEAIRDPYVIESYIGKGATTWRTP